MDDSVRCVVGIPTYTRTRHLVAIKSKGTGRLKETRYDV